MINSSKLERSILVLQVLTGTTVAMVTNSDQVVLGMLQNYA